jgi:hypothetical protein
MARRGAAGPLAVRWGGAPDGAYHGPSMYPPTPAGCAPWLRGLTGAETDPDKRFTMGRKRNRLTTTKSSSGSEPWAA